MTKISRKDFLKKAGMLSLGTVAVAAFLESCGGGEEAPKSGEAPEIYKPKEKAQEPKSAEPATSSTDQASVDCAKHNTNLTEADQKAREGLKYVDKTEKPDQNCKNCRFYQPDKFDGACGGCQLFANGAVNPNGWCMSWAAPA